MRLKMIMLLCMVMIVFATGCGKDNKDNVQPVAASISEKYTVVTESDIMGTYTMPVFRNMNNQDVQTLINNEIVSNIDKSSVNERKENAIELLSATDLSGYGFNEFGTYKVYCNDGKYLCFYLSVEQRFSDGEKTKFTKQNKVYNFDVETGENIDISTIFADPDATADYIAEKLYERLLGMDCLESSDYKASVFKNDIFDHCVIVSSNKIAVVTTAGKFNLKSTAGAPSVEISIPDEHYLKSK